MLGQVPLVFNLYGDRHGIAHIKGSGGLGIPISNLITVQAIASKSSMRCQHGLTAVLRRRHYALVTGMLLPGFRVTNIHLFAPEISRPITSLFYVEFGLGAVKVLHRPLLRYFQLVLANLDVVLFKQRHL